MNIQTNSLPELSDSTLKSSSISIAQALFNKIEEDGKIDSTESINILKNFYSKGNPLLDINGNIPTCGLWTPLSIAAYYNNHKAIKFLLENGADPNLAHDNMSFPLHMAAAKGNEICIFELLRGGAYINKIDEKGKTAIMRACERKDLKRSTIELFFNKTITNEDLDLNLLYANKSCLDIAKETGSPEIAKLLSYLSLKTKLVPKGITEKRVKI